MILGNLIPWKKEWSVSVTSRLVGLAFALAIGSVSMTALIHNKTAMALFAFATACMYIYNLDGDDDRNEKEEYINNSSVQTTW